MMCLGKPIKDGVVFVTVSCGRCKARQFYGAHDIGLGGLRRAKMTQSTRPTEVDIQYSPNGRMTDNDHAIIDDLVATIGNLDLSTTHHSALRRAYQIPTAINFVIANLGLLLKLFGVTDYFKTRMQERAKLDAKLSARKRLQSRLSDSPMVEKTVRSTEQGYSAVNLGPYV